MDLLVVELETLLGCEGSVTASFDAPVEQEKLVGNIFEDWKLILHVYLKVKYR